MKNQSIKLISFLTIFMALTQHSLAESILPSTPARIEAGKTLYQKNCMACHGEKGDGNGPAGKLMNPHPRNFKGAKFVNGDKPENLFKTISEGLPGTAMAPFKTLTTEEKSSIVHYVLKLKAE